MASALLALAKPVYEGFKSERKFIKENPDIVGERGSLKRLKSIPYGFKSFGEGFIGAGGAQAVVKGVVGMKKEGGMNCPTPPPPMSFEEFRGEMKKKEKGKRVRVPLGPRPGISGAEPPARVRVPAVHSAMGGGHILAAGALAMGSPVVLGALPAAALMRERHRLGTDLRRAVVG